MVKQKKLDEGFRALADRTRRGMLDRLRRCGEQSLTQLAEPFEMSLPAAAKHVAVLERAGLVMVRKVGRERRVAYDPRGLDKQITWLLDQQAQWSERFGRLKRHVGDDYQK